ncbi:MAG TPA: TraR/DksA family transcriptional regulator [Pyrinomonadaceae bacterium]|nr:TraR/DksA family transcriptional regulator [Pyrinomonadaceae bacterium]
MDEQKLERFRTILLEQLRQHEEQVRDNTAAALEMVAADDGVKDSVDLSLQDVNQEIQFRLGERESQMVAEIDQALLRMDEGSYGVCARCGKEIPERRLEAVPTARYDAECQSLIEANEGLEDAPTL